MTDTAPQPLDPKPAPRYLKATIAGAGGLLALLWFLVEQRPELAQLLLERIVMPVHPEPRAARRRRARAAFEIVISNLRLGCAHD